MKGQLLAKIYNRLLDHPYFYYLIILTAYSRFLFRVRMVLEPLEQ